MLPFYYEMFDAHQNFIGCIVAIASYDLNYAPVWLGEHFAGLNRTYMVPCLDICGEVHEFNAPEDARQFIKEWWMKQE